MSFAVIGLAALVASQSAAVEIARAEQERLNECIRLSRVNPEAAYEAAQAWISQGSRPKARYCLALALVERGDYEAGAMRFETLANAPDAGTIEERGRYLTQAGNAWLTAGRPEAAIVALSNALKLLPNTADLHKDRGAAYALLQRWDESLADLDQALAIEPGDPDGLRLRAEARLATDDLQAALEDVEAARLAAPQDIDLLVLRGRIREAIRVSGAP